MLISLHSSPRKREHGLRSSGTAEVIRLPVRVDRARDEARRRSWERRFKAGKNPDPFAPGGPWSIHW